MLILALQHLLLHVNSPPDSNLVQVLVIDLLLQSLLKLTTSLEEEVRICYVQLFVLKKKRINYFGLAYFLYHILYKLVLEHFGFAKSVK